MNERYLTTEEAAQRLRVTRRSVLGYLKSGKLQGAKTVTGYWRIPESEVDRFLGVTTESVNRPCDEVRGGTHG